MHFVVSVTIFGIILTGELHLEQYTYPYLQNVKLNICIVVVLDKFNGLIKLVYIRLWGFIPSLIGFNYTLSQCSMGYPPARSNKKYYSLLIVNYTILGGSVK